MDPVIRLTGARVALSATISDRFDLQLRRGRVLPFDSTEPADEVIDLSGHLLLPGLVNPHDHLDFALFPRLGKGPWSNASQWACAIYKPELPPVCDHLRIPKKDRLWWGAIRNLVSGVTTVAHHNPWEASVFSRSFPVRVVRRYGWAHSLSFAPNLAQLSRQTPIRWPFILHAAEGTDQAAHAEIPALDAAGLLSRRTVLVHAVATDTANLETIYQRGSSIVWCPSSNLFTLGQTLSPAALHSGIQIALGTDSPLTSDGDMRDEIAAARRAADLSPEEIYPMVTSGAARILRLTDGQGTIRSRGAADLVAVKDTGQSPAETVCGLNPEMVMVGGKILLATDRFVPKAKKGFHSLALEGRGSWMVRADIPALTESASDALGSGLRLGGKLILQ